MQNDPQFNSKLNQFATDLLQRAAQPQTPQDEELSTLLELSETDQIAAEEQFFQRYVAGVILFDEMAEQRRFSDAFLEEMRRRKQQGMSMAEIAAIAPMVAEHSMNRMPGRKQSASTTQTTETASFQISDRRPHKPITVAADIPIMPTKADKSQDHFNVQAAKQNVAEQRGSTGQNASADTKKSPKRAGSKNPQNYAPQIPVAQTSTTQQSQPQQKKGMGIFGKVALGSGIAAGAGGIMEAVAIFNAIQ